MAMAENNNIFVNDRKVIVDNGGLELNSPWKKRVEMPAESPVMGKKAWPTLLDVKLAKTAEVSSPVPQVKQISDVHKISNGGGNGNFSNKHGQQRFHRDGPKQNQKCSRPFPVSVVSRVYYPQGAAVSPPIPGPAYGYWPMPAPFPGVDNRSTQAGSQIPVNTFGVNQNFQSPAQADISMNAPKYSVGRIPSPAEGGHLYWQGPRSKSGAMMPHEVAPGAYMRPAFISPGPFVRGPAFPGPVHMHYRHMPPPGWIRAPLFPGFAPRLVNPLSCSLPPELLALRERIVKQIEYYFSDENLRTNHYMISQMNENGWVPISVIAEFKRIKSMCTDVRFILDALQQSKSVEVQGNLVRKFDSKVKASTDSQTRANIGSPIETDSKADTPCSDSDPFDTSLNHAPSPNLDKLSNNFPSTLAA